MTSRTKNRITNFEIKELVRSNFGEDAVIASITELEGGMFNAAYIINFSPDCSFEPKAVVLKLSPREETKVLTYEKEIMRTEVQIYSIFERNSIPVPHILKSDFTHKLIDCDYFFMEKLQGKTWYDLKKRLSPQNAAALKEELGEYMAKIHKIKGNYYGYIKTDEQFHFEWWSDAFESFINNIFGDGKKGKIPLPYNRIRKILEPHMMLLADVHSPVLVNFDIWERNVFLVAEGGEYRIEALIDHERAYFGDPLAEFVASPTLFNADLSKEKALIKGYESVTGKKFILTSHDRIRILMYRVYLDLIMAVEIYRYSGIVKIAMYLFARFMLEKHLTQLEDSKNIYDKRSELHGKDF